MKLLFDPSVGRPMNIVPWGSGSGSNIEKMIQHSKSGQTNYRVPAVVYDVGDPQVCKIPEILQKHKEIRPIYADSSAVRADPKNADVRREYYSSLVHAINDYALVDGFNVDLVPLGGFMLKITEPALSTFRFVNVHPALLGVRDEAGKRKYTGDKAVLKVVKDRVPFTGSTVHILTEKVDEGEILVQSKSMPIPYELLFAHEGLESFASFVQGLQKALCDWPAYVTALDFISRGKFAMEEGEPGKRAVYFDGEALPYDGLVL